MLDVDNFSAVLARCIFRQQFVIECQECLAPLELVEILFGQSRKSCELKIHDLLFTSVYVKMVYRQPVMKNTAARASTHESLHGLP